LQQHCTGSIVNHWLSMKNAPVSILVLVAILVCARGQDGTNRTQRVPSAAVEAGKIPEPPQSHKPWTPPAKDFPTNLLSSVDVLFSLGFPDPRGCEYREFEAVVGSDRDGNGKVAAHGWILPRQFGDKQSFAVSWAGTIYPSINVGGRANLKQDVEALLRGDEIWRKAAASQQFAIRGYLGAKSEAFSISETNMTALKVALLLRLGEEKLARDYWNAWLAPGITILNHSKEDVKDPFRTLACEWTWALFDRAICAHMRGDDALALADCRHLNQVWPALETEASQRKYYRPQYLDSGREALPRPYFYFLEPLAGLLADQERRAQEMRHDTIPQTGSEKSPDKIKRIAALISSLDEVAETQWSWPGSDPTIMAFVEEGDDAVEPLLDCLENDRRLTRSVSFGRDLLPGSILPVRQAAETALDEILRVHFENAAEYRAYWQKYKSVPLIERWYGTLLDDQAGRKQWLQAAKNILSRTDGKIAFLWKNAPIPNATNHYTYVADCLRSKSGPSVAELLLKRAREIAPTNYVGSVDCWTFDDAADLGLMLAEWEGQPAAPALAKIIQHCPILYAKAHGSWSSGCGIVQQHFAALAVAMAELGNTTGLDLYAEWVRDKRLDDLNDALPGALSPFGRFPNHPSIKEASARLFRATNGDWLSSPHWVDLIKTRLVLNEAFRALILPALADWTKAGTIVLKADGDFEIRTEGGSEGGLLNPDAWAPKAGEIISFRVCDNIARRLSRIDGLPILKLYWPEAKRDEVISLIVRFLKDNDGSLKLKPAAWMEYVD
jgi:hypothetical protein